MSSRRGKIVATLGPSSSDREAIREILRVAVDLVPLNLSHGSHEAHRAIVEAVRSEAKGRHGYGPLARGLIIEAGPGQCLSRPLPDRSSLFTT